MEDIKAIKVYALENMVIGVMFSNGEFKKYDLEPLCKKWPVFNTLKDIKLFKKAKVDVGGYGIVWNDEIDIAMEEVYANGVAWENAPLADYAIFNIVAQFRKLRHQKGITQYDLAEKTGIKQSNIARMESGGRLPNITTLIKLGNALGYTLHWGK